MNTANLQLEGLYLAIAAVNKALVANGVLTQKEIDTALRTAEETAMGDCHLEELSLSNREAVAFPARLLALANSGAPETEVPSFSELAKMIGETRDPVLDP